MSPKKFEIWIANLNPSHGTEPGKVRPVVVVQSNMLNSVHPSTLICPLTSKTVRGVSLLRVHLPKKKSGLEADSDILVDQLRAIDNRRLAKKAGMLTSAQSKQLLNNLRLLVLE